MSAHFDAGIDYEDFHEDFYEDPIEAYFARFPSFTYIPGPDWRQLRAFYDLADHFGWDWCRKKHERALLTKAWTQVLETEFKGFTLLHYQLLCRDLRIVPIPETVQECKEKLGKVHVNIVDLMQYRWDRVRGVIPMAPPLFVRLKDLSQYSWENGKIFRLEDAKSEMLNVLLRKIGSERRKPGVGY